MVWVGGGSRAGKLREGEVHRGGAHWLSKNTASACDHTSNPFCTCPDSNAHTCNAAYNCSAGSICGLIVCFTLLCWCAGRRACKSRLSSWPAYSLAGPCHYQSLPSCMQRSCSRCKAGWHRYVDVQWTHCRIVWDVQAILARTALPGCLDAIMLDSICSKQLAKKCVTPADWGGGGSCWCTCITDDLLLWDCCAVVAARCTLALLLQLQQPVKGH